MFWIGFIAGVGIGGVLLMILFAFLMRIVLSRKDKSNEAFLEVQSTNGDHLSRIADHLEDLARLYRGRN